MADAPPTYDEHHSDTTLLKGAPQRNEEKPPLATVRSLIQPASTAESSQQKVPEHGLGGVPPPPSYARSDPAAQVYAYRPPLICSATISATQGPDPDPDSFMPRYQLMQELTAKSGKPWKLHIRPLVPSEIRCLSFAALAIPSYETTLSSEVTSSSPPTSPVSPTSPKRAELVPFDDDTTLYTTTSRGPFEIASPRPLSARVFSGSIRVESVGGGLKSKPGLSPSGILARFWHVTRNEAMDSLRPENRERMEKRGYHAEDELKERLLFEVARMPGKGRRMSLGWGFNGGAQAKYEWRDVDGQLVGEESERTSWLRLVDGEGMGVKIREALITCWAARCWASGRWRFPAGES
jgi:hypothetical protein